MEVIRHDRVRIRDRRDRPLLDARAAANGHHPDDAAGRCRLVPGRVSGTLCSTVARWTWPSRLAGSARSSGRHCLLFGYGSPQEDRVAGNRLEVAFSDSGQELGGRCSNPLACAYCVSRSAASPVPRAEAAETFPVVIRIERSRSLGPLVPIWRFFGADEPNYATMPNGKKLLGELGELKPDAVYFRTHNLLTSGDGTPALKWGSTGAYREDAERQARFTTGRFSTKSLTRIVPQGVRPYVQIGFMPRELSIEAGAVPARVDCNRSVRARSLPVGPIRRRITRNGRSSCIQWAKALPSSGTATRRLRPGTGRRGTRRIFAIGRARRRSSASCTITRSPACDGRFRTPEWAGRTWRVAAASSRAISTNTASVGRTMRPAKWARRSTLCRFTPRVRRGSSRTRTVATYGWESPSSSGRSTTASRSWRRFRN